MQAVAHFPGSFNKDLLPRARRPLIAIVVLLLAVDAIVLGLHLADAVDSPFAGDDPSPVRARVGGPEAVVPGSAVAGAQASRRAGAPQAAAPLGCLAMDSGCFPGATVTSPPPTAPGTAPPPTTPGPDPTPLAQADLAVPALGTQVSLGLGDGGCTSVKLTVLALGDCPVQSGDGPVIMNLGGALLGN